MGTFLNKLRARNSLLYYFGWLNILGALFSVLMSFIDDTQVLGINAWIKPLKFFLSVTIFCWTMGWLMVHLNNQGSVHIYSIVVVLVLAFEMTVIAWQAANGRLSHFNISEPLYATLFSLMGVAIVILVGWTIYICYLFFRQKQFSIPGSYLWGIRLGLVSFIVFSFEGGLMAAQLAHTVGAPDGGDGMPMVNWSRQYGDLRIAHFIGMHALQALPLAGYFVFRKPAALIVFSVLYIFLAAAVLMMALKGLPIIKY